MERYVVTVSGPRIKATIDLCVEDMPEIARAMLERAIELSAATPGTTNQQGEAADGR